MDFFKTARVQRRQEPFPRQIHHMTSLVDSAADGARATPSQPHRSPPTRRGRPAHRQV
jgi:hypothetical protein